MIFKGKQDVHWCSGSSSSAKNSIQEST